MTKVIVEEKFTELKDCKLMDGIKIFIDEVGYEVYGLIVNKEQNIVQVNYYDTFKEGWVSKIFEDDIPCTLVQSVIKFTVEQ